MPHDECGSGGLGRNGFRPGLTFDEIFKLKIACWRLLFRWWGEMRLMIKKKAVQ